MRFLTSLLFLLGLAACSQQGWIDRFASRDEQTLVIRVAQQLRDGDAVDILQIAEPQFRADIPRAVAAVRPILSQAKGPLTIVTVSVLRFNGGPTTKSFDLQAGSDGHWAVVEVVLRGSGGPWQLAGFHVRATNSEPAKLNDFRINQRGVLGFVWLAVMAACVGTCLTAIVLIWRTRWLNRRWLWTLGSLFGFIGFGLNWSTGAWAILFGASLLGAQATKAGPFAPWLLSFFVPVIAIVVVVLWVRERRSNDDVGTFEVFK